MSGVRQAIRITLVGDNNISYTGTLTFGGHSNQNLELPQSFPETNLTDERILIDGALSNSTKSAEYDYRGASYFIVAVVMVYSLSIVALIASHIKRRHDKFLEDKQIDKYLQDFQIVKERQARDSYKKLKRSVMEKLNWERTNKRGMYRNLHKSIIPVLAIGMPGSSLNSSTCSMGMLDGSAEMAFDNRMSVLNPQAKPRRARSVSVIGFGDMGSYSRDDDGIIARIRRNSQRSSSLLGSLMSIEEVRESTSPTSPIRHPSHLNLSRRGSSMGGGLSGSLFSPVPGRRRSMSSCSHISIQRSVHSVSCIPGPDDEIDPEQQNSDNEETNLLQGKCITSNSLKVPGQDIEPERLPLVPIIDPEPVIHPVTKKPAFPSVRISVRGPDGEWEVCETDQGPVSSGMSACASTSTPPSALSSSMAEVDDVWTEREIIKNEHNKRTLEQTDTGRERQLPPSLKIANGQSSSALTQSSPGFQKKRLSEVFLLGRSPVRSPTGRSKGQLPSLEVSALPENSEGSKIEETLTEPVGASQRRLSNTSELSTSNEALQQVTVV